MDPGSKEKMPGGPEKGVGQENKGNSCRRAPGVDAALRLFVTWFVKMGQMPATQCVNHLHLHSKDPSVLEDAGLHFADAVPSTLSYFPKEAA